jgi:hypothetical protein
MWSAGQLLLLLAAITENTAAANVQGPLEPAQCRSGFCPLRFVKTSKTPSKTCFIFVRAEVLVNSWKSFFHSFRFLRMTDDPRLNGIMA